VPTPVENEQHGRRVGLLRRLAAICYDLLLVLGLLMTLAFTVIVLRAGDAIGPGAAWFQLLLLAAWGLYFTWSWTHGGQTIGMRAWRVHVQAREGGSVSWGSALVRFLGAALSVLAFGLGFLWCLVDRDGLTWHDRLSRSELSYRPKTNASGQQPTQ
jgi:uncharacterized RDD family membrane protein YckC